VNSNPASDNTCETQYWVAQDANYNVLGLVDSSGTLVERYEYTPYGQRTVYFSTGANDPALSAAAPESRRVAGQAFGLCDFGHQGLMLDAESGLYYNRARYYHPTLGVFTARDPLGYVDGGSLYQYEKSSPELALDPSGLLVDVTFDLRTGAITARDRDTGKQVTIPAGCAFSGRKPEKLPIFTGKYDILHMPDRPDKGWYNWFRLDPVDSQRYNDRADDHPERDPASPSTPRGLFRLHPGRTSAGCVTVKKEDKTCMEKYNELVNLLRNTKKGSAKDANGHFWDASIDVYGTITVIDSSPTTGPTTQPVMSPL
jgi:RHS repeat-associated protein